MAAVLGISGAAAVAWADPPQLEDVGHIDIFGGSLSTFHFFEPCRRFSFEFGASNETVHSGVFGSEDNGRVVVIMEVYDGPSGVLYHREETLLMPDPISGNVVSAEVSLELAVDEYQCDLDPTCSGPSNCVWVGEAPLLVDLTWTGIGTPQNTSGSSTFHDIDWIVNHINNHFKAREATVSGVVSVGDLDFDIEDDLGELLRLSRGIVNLRSPDCVDC